MLTHASDADVPRDVPLPFQLGNTQKTQAAGKEIARVIGGEDERRVSLRAERARGRRFTGL